MKAKRIAAAVALAAAAAAAGAALSSMRTSSAPSAAAETPWVRYVMVGLGGFRGVISEVLWIRADRLQEQGRYFELAQLSDWICALDPRAADAWSFNAWNLSYNICAMVPSPDAKLHWVLAGISLLRDRAIPANPSAPSLYRELGWLYQNKIGTPNDPASTAYRLDVAADAARAPEDRRHPLDPATVREVENRFGPLDWRLPQSHAIHWAWRGLATGPTGFELEALRRMVHQNLVAMILAGEFAGDAANGVWEAKPRWELVPATMDFFEESIAITPGETRIYRYFLDAMAKRVPRPAYAAIADKAAARLAELGGPEEEDER